MKEADALIDRCPTGIAGFDALCEGGLVRNSVNTVSGNAGTGKSIFLMQFLYNGAMQFQENGIYITFEVDPLEIYKDGSMFGWNLQKLDDLGKCKFFKVDPYMSVADMKRELMKLVAKYDAKRICFDPISLFQANESDDSKIRMKVFELVSMLKRMQVTTLISDENPGTDSESNKIVSANSRSEFSKFLADGYIELFSSGLGGMTDRAVRIGKMRRTNHSRGPVPMQISNKGMEVLSKGKRGLL